MPESVTVAMLRSLQGREATAEDMKGLVIRAGKSGGMNCADLASAWIAAKLEIHPEWSADTREPGVLVGSKRYLFTPRPPWRSSRARTGEGTDQPGQD